MTDILTFSNTTFNIECLVVDGVPWFKGKQVATILGYVNTRKAILDHVDEDEKINLEELRRHESLPLDHNAKNAVFINEAGLYSLILKSQKDESRIFKKWVTTDVLPSIRKTGMYRMMDTPQQQQIRIYSESDLHRKVVEFMRNHLPGHIVVPGLGELQDTVQKRSLSYHKGYRGGQPDLLILNSHKTYRGFAIELKTPKGNGQMSENQQQYMDMLHQNGFKTLVSNNYDEIVVELTKYFQDVRFKCNHCPKAFKTTATQETHERCMHGKRARLTEE
jgi:prophage antirepressor-like protein